ncbi:hypothetical protein ACSNOK_15755 [Streptomyces sp. URMC 126]|uniref:hypothetical protein n=1 Tax=Streptomyces sp. URMC 126 TaxID=3423401 RepID=UPI003F1ACDA1
MKRHIEHPQARAEAVRSEDLADTTVAGLVARAFAVAGRPAVPPRHGPGRRDVRAVRSHSAEQPPKSAGAGGRWT